MCVVRMRVCMRVSACVCALVCVCVFDILQKLTLPSSPNLAVF